MSQQYNESRRRLLLVTGAMLVAALGMDIIISRGEGGYLATIAFLSFLLVAGTSIYQLYRRK